MEETTKKFATLFAGNQRSHGVYTPKGMSTVRKPPTFGHFEKHLKGEIGLGVVPIMDNGLCWWGAIDIDCHNAGESIDIPALEKHVRSLDLPLMVCRSKSGGVHLYLFCSEPVNVKLIRSILNKWATQLHFGGSEIFPKQDVLSGKGENQQLGNWINLCYYDAEKTERYCLEGGKEINIEYFIEIAESRRLSAAMLVERGGGEFDEAPPCIQKLLKGVDSTGMRNEALYNICIYFKQAYPDNWKDKGFDVNAKVFEYPLSHSEAKKIIVSVGRRDYRYRCKNEPIKSLCNSSVCIKKKYGITEEENAEIFIGKQPEFDLLKKYLTDPVRWGLVINNVEVPLSTNDLMDHRCVRIAIANTMTQIIPPMKNDSWLVLLKKLMDEVVLVDVPDEASSVGLVWQHLIQFLQRTDFDSDGTDIVDRNILFRGVPVVQEKDGERVIYFRGSDFVNYLKKNRTEDLKGPNLWFALRNYGVGYGPLRIGKIVRQVWYVPVSQVSDQNLNDDHDEQIILEY